MRYTEAKLAPIALELLRDIEKNTVSWSYNFDDTCKEPDMLPGRFPNLLVNGGTGIAVGLATNIPTHNLREVCDAVCAFIDNKNISLKELLKIMPGPDFPTGAYILKTSEIKQVYETGKGKIFMRSKLHIENAENGKKNIVITEIPYQVNKAVLLRKIATLKDADNNGGVLSYISDIIDESDRNGMRAVIKLKKDARVGLILASLFKNTDLQTTFNANIVAIADGRPKQLGLIEIIDYYVKYQQKIVYNRTKFDLEACLKKEHVLEGLLIAINNIDKVIKIIKQSKSVTDAKSTLMEVFNLSEIQAQAILDMRLSRLTSLEVNRLIEELNKLKELIKRYTAVLKSPSLQIKIVKQELMQVSKDYGGNRKSEFLNPVEDAPEDDSSISDEEVGEVNIIFTPMRTIKSVLQKNYNLSIKELNGNSNLYEIPQISLKVQTNKDIYAFTNLGNCVKLPVDKIAKCKFKDKGANLSAYYTNIEDNEKVVACLELLEEEKDKELLFATKKGMIKITKVSQYFSNRQAINAIKLKDEDEVISVEFNNKEFLSLFTKKGIGMVVEKNDILSTGRATSGVIGIKLNENDEVISANIVNKGDVFTLFYNNGSHKAIDFVSIPTSLRNKKGVKIIPQKHNGGVQIVKADILNPNINYVLEEKDGKLHYILSSSFKPESIQNLGKFVRNVRGAEVVSNVYDYQLS